MVEYVGWEFMAPGNLAFLCVANGLAIFATIFTYKKISWIHSISPLLLLTQLAALVQPAFFKLSPKAENLLQNSFLLVYCLCQCALTTKWYLQAPFALLVSQVGLYLTNQLDLDGPASDVTCTVLLNSLLPTFIFGVSKSLHLSKVSLFLAKMSEAISQIETDKILQMIP